ncbi:MAG TPA: DNA polymerase III subunit gamma/tau [Solirubrobacterales bacterium]|jgi:DNA polymerase-3 subunit gamma/tau|nr:DNA polymerase III subunit gamma/tau [Solirubrobacterales bacterium]
MSESTSLYRRHRPGSFDEVVGQTHVVRTLRNAVEGGKVHHAYLFVGSRGTGKTSMAKILARSLNCERGGPTVTPCGECESCVTIAAGTSVDVIEMDAASNRSVDDVRDLRERVAYAPTGGRWKVYILDEAHMLTKEAWNAFLKTLEEPPPNTVFVLATTESHKVMATIADRCQRFDFQRPSLEQISEVLNRVAAAESLEVDEGAAAMIARSAQGSFRDALGTLDQLVAFGGDHVELKDVLEMLGAADADLLFEAVDAVIAEDPKGVLIGVEKMARSGRDPSQFARDLLAHLRHLLIAQTTGEVPTSFVATATDTARMQAQASAISAANLIRTIDEVADALTAVREGDDARLAVEIALLKAARPDLDPDTAGLLRRIERLEQGVTPPTTPPTAETPPQADPPPAEEEEAEAAPSDETVEVPKSVSDDSPAGDAVGGTTPEEALATGRGGGSPAAAGPAGQDASVPDSGNPDALSLDDIQRVWPAVLQKLEETAPALAGALEGARPVSFGEEGLQVGFPPDMTFLKRNADSPEKRDTVAAAFAAVTGTGLRPTYVLLDGEAPPDTPAPGSEEIDEDRILERLKSEFDAEEVS